MTNLRDFNSNSTTWFVLVGEGLEKVSRGGTHSFRGYSDNANAHGKGTSTYIQYVTSKDDRGKELGKWFTLDESRRKFQVREGEHDIQGITQYDFLKYSPDCEGSPNGSYVSTEAGKVQQGIMYRELNQDKDARIALEADSKRINAQAKVLSLDLITLQELAAFIGVFGEPGELMRVRVLEWAAKRPDDFIRLLSSGDRGLRAVVRKALADGVLTQRGTIIYWADTMIGSDEDSAISTLAGDPQMYEALATKVDLKTPAKITPSTPAAPKGKRGPKPGSKRTKPPANTKNEKEKTSEEIPKLESNLSL